MEKCIGFLAACQESFCGRENAVSADKDNTAIDASSLSGPSIWKESIMRYKA